MNQVVVKKWIKDVLILHTNDDWGTQMSLMLKNVASFERSGKAGGRGVKNSNQQGLARQ